MKNAVKVSLVCCLVLGTSLAFSQQPGGNSNSASYQVANLEVSASASASKAPALLKDNKTTTPVNDSSKTGAVKQSPATAMNNKPIAIPASFNPATVNNNNTVKNNNGIENTIAGYMALQNNTEGVGNTAVGSFSLHKNTTGLNNTANGSYAMASNTSGQNNTAIGSLALTTNISGSANTAIGYQSLLGIAAGNNNTAIGYNAMVFATNGNNNTAIGTSSLSKNFEGNNNTATGINTLENNLGGSNNVSNGVRALQKNAAGNNNTAVGFESLVNNVNGSFNTVLGYKADINADGIYNATALGSGAKVNASNTIQLGNADVTSVNTNGNLHAAGLALNADDRFRQHIRPLDNGLSTILQLNPVHYEKKTSIEGTAYTKAENGFVAQEIQKVLPFLVTEGSDKNKLLSVDYISLIPILTKALQEQQAQIQQQSDDIKALKKMVQQLLEKKP